MAVTFVASHGSFLFTGSNSSTTLRWVRRVSIHCKRLWCSISAGISYFTEENRFPVTWRLVRVRRYFCTAVTGPTEWDIYWRLAPCEIRSCTSSKRMKSYSARPRLKMPGFAPSFVIQSLILTPPSRVEFHRRAQISPMWVADVERPEEESICGSRPPLIVAETRSRRPEADALFRAGARGSSRCIAVCGLGLAATRDHSRRRLLPSVSVERPRSMVATFFAVGVASDFRYGYFAVLAAIAGRA